MSGKLRLGPLPKTELVRLTIALPAAVKANLDLYAQLYGATYGEAVDAPALVPHMLRAFMDKDRAFRKARHTLLVGERGDQLSEDTRDATSSAIETAADGSSR